MITRVSRAPDLAQLNIIQRLVCASVLNVWISIYGRAAYLLCQDMQPPQCTHTAYNRAVSLTQATAVHSVQTLHAAVAQQRGPNESFSVMIIYLQQHFCLQQHSACLPLP